MHTISSHKVVELPVLPRYIARFRGEPWFNHHFPRALPASFNHIRPPALDDGTPQQVTLRAFIDLLLTPIPLIPRTLQAYAKAPVSTYALLHTTGDKDRYIAILRAIQALASDIDFDMHETVIPLMLSFLDSEVGS